MQNFLLSALDNGMRVITEPLPSVRSVAFGFWIGTGSRDEAEEQAGATHFLEHLLFKGTEQYSALEIAEIFDTFGAELNAATAREYTVVYARVLDEQLERALDVVWDMVFAPTLGELDSEREVVLEEIAMVEDAPQELVHDLATKAVFAGHPLGRPVIGYGEVIASISAEEIAAYHAARYVGPNIVVSAAGNVEHPRFVELLERLDQRRRSGTASPTVRTPLVAAPPPSLRFLAKETEQYNLCLAAPALARTDRRRFAASILDGILGGSASSRLFQEIREKRGLAYSVYTFASHYVDTGLIGVYIGTREENLRACVEIVAAEIEEIVAGRLRPQELERAKESLKGRIMLSLESTASRMNRLGKSVVTESELPDLDRLLADVDAVDAESVSQLAGLLLAPERLSAAAIGPREETFVEALRPLLPDLVAVQAA